MSMLNPVVLDNRLIKSTALLVLCVSSSLAMAKSVNIPTDLGRASPLFGAPAFDQQMLRFEEFAVRPMPSPGSTTPKTLPVPSGSSACIGRPNLTAMDTFLDDPLWPDPTIQANARYEDPPFSGNFVNPSATNPWAATIHGCLGLPAATTFYGVMEGRPHGSAFAHQRWTEFPPQVYFQTAQGGARANKGILDAEQSHSYSVGEFGPVVTGQENQTGLYHNVTGASSGSDGTTNGIDIRFHPNMPIQDSQALWTFGDGTLPPKLLRARYGQPILFRHYNVLPIDVTANFGFGEHTITTHEHNGHNPGEVDGFAGAYFFPGEFYDYRWPMTLAGHDSVNTDASDPRASTPCSPGEVLKISDPIGGTPVNKTCDPVTHTVNIPGDFHEIMSTHWFHDHMIDRTAQNVYKGNAAMMNYYSGIDRGHESFRCNYADPGNNINLCFPSGTALEWGNRDYDVQLLVADKAWDTAGQLAYSPMDPLGSLTGFLDGFLGDVMTVNWLYKPYFDVRARKYRFRILNGAVSRFFKIAIVREHNAANGDAPGNLPGPAGSGLSYSRLPFHMIANDGNIMEHAVPFPNTQSKDLPVQAIAERYDIIIDFKDMPVGTKIFMVNTLQHDKGDGPKGIIPLANILSGLYSPGLNKDNTWDADSAVGKFLELRVQPYSGTDNSMNPADYEVGKLTMIPKVKFTDAELANAKHRSFHMGRAGGGGTDAKPWGITTDGVGGTLTADVARVSAAPEIGEVEIWHITSGGGWGHPVHVHFEEGQLLRRYDFDAAGNVYNAHLPPLWEQGARKDLYRLSSMGKPLIDGGLGLPDSSLGIDIAIRFREFLGTFVEHCHNTQHEDTAMLLRWDAENPGQATRIPTPMPTWNGVTYVATSSLPTVKSGDVLAKAAAPDPNLGATSTTPFQLSADINWDGQVTLVDFYNLSNHFGSPGPWRADISEDLQVTLTDFFALSNQFGKRAGIPLAPPDPLP